MRELLANALQMLAQSMPEAQGEVLRAALPNSPALEAANVEGLRRFEAKISKAIDETRVVLAAQTKLRERRDEMERILAQPLPDDLRTTLRGLVQVAETQSNPLEAIAKIDRELQRAGPRIEEVKKIARAVTSGNRFVLEGDPEDTVILFNVSPKAPSVTKGLRGEVEFDPTRTAACVFPAAIDDRVALRLLAQTLRRVRAPPLMPLVPCAVDRLQGQDVVVFRRGLIWGQSAGNLITLLSSVDAGIFETLTTISGAELRAAVQAEAVKRTEIEAEIESGAPGAFAMIAPAGSTSVLCRVVASNVEAHDQLLRTYQERLTEEFNGLPAAVTTSAAGAFRAAKRGQCGAIYASIPDLKEITTGLRRDGVQFGYLPLRIAPEDIRAEVQALADKEKDRQEAEVEAHRQAALARLNLARPKRRKR